MEAPGADLLAAATGLGAGTGDRLRVRVLGESVARPAERSGSEYESAIRALQWVYLAEDLSDCLPGEQPEFAGELPTEGVVRRTGDLAAVERAATRFRELASAESEADTVQGSLMQGDATSEYTAYLDPDGKVARVEERLNFGDYGSRRVVYGFSDGALFYVREEGVLRNLVPDGAGELRPRGFEAALDARGRVLGSQFYGPGFPEGIEQAVRGAEEHLDRLLDLVSERVAVRVPTG